MRINAFSDVSLRVLIVLAAAPVGAEVMTSTAISVQVGTPYHHVTKIVARLRELDLIDVTRGRAGGVRLSPAGRRVTVGWVLRTLDTRTDVADCTTLHGDCPLLEGCRLRGALARAREAFFEELDDIVVSSLAHQPRGASTTQSLGLSIPVL